MPVRGRIAGVGEGHGGPRRVVGRFCRLPVAPGQSRRRAAEQFTGFPTGRPRGRGRGRACELPGRVLHAPSRPGAGGHPRGPGSPPLAAPRPAAPRASSRRGAETQPLAFSLLPLAAARSPASPELSPAQGAVSTSPLPFDSPGSPRRRRWEGSPPPQRRRAAAAQPVARTASAGNRLRVAARLERAEPGAARERWRVQTPPGREERGAPSQVCFSLSVCLGQMTPSFHRTARAAMNVRHAQCGGLPMPALTSTCNDGPEYPG